MIDGNGVQTIRDLEMRLGRVTALIREAVLEARFVLLVGAGEGRRDVYVDSLVIVWDSVVGVEAAIVVDLLLSLVGGGGGGGATVTNGGAGVINDGGGIASKKIFQFRPLLVLLAACITRVGHGVIILPIYTDERDDQTKSLGNPNATITDVGTWSRNTFVGSAKSFRHAKRAIRPQRHNRECREHQPLVLPKAFIA